MSIMEKMQDTKTRKAVIATTVGLATLFATAIAVVTITNKDNGEKLENNQATVVSTADKRVHVGSYECFVSLGSTVKAQDALDVVLNSNNGVTPLGSANTFDYQTAKLENNVVVTFEDGSTEKTFEEKGTVEEVILAESDGKTYEYAVKLLVSDNTEEVTPEEGISTAVVIEEATVETTEATELVEVIMTEINENGEVVETVVTEVVTVPVEEVMTEVATEAVNTEAPAPVVTEATTVRSEETTVKTTTAPKMTTEAPKTTKATTVATTKATTQATTVATTRATTVATTVATTAAPVQNPINADSYYGTPWTAKEMGGDRGIVWLSPTNVVVCSIASHTVLREYTIPSEYLNDFMYVYNNELSYGQTYDTAINQAAKYIAKIQQVGRDNVLYTNDIEDDGVVRPTWGVWWTLDGEYWVTA